MNISKNKRFLETDSKITAAFITLLEHKAYDAITVGDICTTAAISRPSFYSHFDDINDLILKIEQEKAAQISSFLLTHAAAGVPRFYEYFQYLRENRSFYLAFFGSRQQSASTQELMAQYKHSPFTTSMSSKDLSYRMLFFMSGLKAIAFEWLLGDCEEPVGLMVELLEREYRVFCE